MQMKEKLERHAENSSPDEFLSRGKVARHMAGILHT